MPWGRREECGALDGLLADVRAGRSRALVVRGEPGIGKTALLGYAVETAQDFRLARAEGVESEMELPFAALQQLCGRMLDRLDQLPAPQRDALGVAFGLRAGSAPDRFLVGLAVLGLLSDVATRPRSSPGGWMSRSATGSSPSPAATRWRCSSCPTERPRRSWPADSAWPARSR